MTYSPYNAVVDTLDKDRETFFKLIFGENIDGYVCIAFLDHATKKIMDQSFFEWPKELPKMLAVIQEKSKGPVHSYFSPILYSTKNRKVESAKYCTNVWADLDDCDPKLLKIEPSIIVSTSPGRWQAYWLLANRVAPAVGEDLSRRIAYHHKADGADTSGWDLTQLLRIPFTLNHKYQHLAELPLVKVTSAVRRLYREREITSKYTQIAQVRKVAAVPMPQPTELAENFLDKYPSLRNDERFHSLYYNAPTGADDWSDRLWSLEMLCLESGLTVEETFQIARSSACNKYLRDGRGDGPLWKEITRARVHRLENVSSLPNNPKVAEEELITTAEVELVRNSSESFIERYISWATGVTDASPQYHQAGALMCLSGLLSGNLSLRTSFGVMNPNLWFAIIGDTTLTRKTTSVNLAMNMLYDVNEEVLLASDGSIEGIFTALAERPKLPSILMRDEFTGFIEAMNKKDYMAGVIEQLTKLYDGDRIKRVLRRDIIDVRDPIFLMYVSGVKSKMQQQLTDEMINSGFIPRFVLIVGEPDLSRIRDMGPEADLKLEARDLLVNELKDLQAHYVKEVEIIRGGNVIGTSPKLTEVTLTPRAWTRFNKFARDMTNMAMASNKPFMLPMYDRLSKSCLKTAILVAASKQRESTVVVDELELLHAIYYTAQWREYANTMISAVGKTQDERLMDSIVSFVRSGTTIGVSRAEIMRHFMLDARRFEMLSKTLEMRLEIFLENGRYYVPV